MIIHPGNRTHLSRSPLPSVFGYLLQNRYRKQEESSGCGHDTYNTSNSKSAEQHAQKQEEQAVCFAASVSARVEAGWLPQGTYADVY